MHKMLFWVVCLAALLYASPLSVNGALSINNDGKFVNEHGNVVQLRGMSLFWDQWAGGWFNENVVKTLASTDANTGWSASVVRAPISQFSTSLASSMMSWANSAGIYVIIDNHSHCAHKATNQAVSFFSSVSAEVKQKNYKHVIYEIYNEPLYNDCNGATDTDHWQGRALTSWSTIKSYAETVIKAIRANDPNGIILVGTERYSQGIGAAQKDPITGYSNIGYVLHFYASDEGHAGLKTPLLRASCQKFPVFITEWGTSEADGNGAFNTSYINSWMAWIEGLGYSWANWSVYDKNETSSAISGGGSSGYWQESQLTQSGKYVRRMIQGFNSGKTLSQMGLTQPTYSDCSAFNGSATIHEFEWTGEGEFTQSIEAENYNDYSGIKPIHDENVSAFENIYVVTDGTEAWARYKMNSVPADGHYKLVFRYQAPNKDIEISYTVDGIAGSTTLTLPKTKGSFTANKSSIALREGTSFINFDLGGVSASDLMFDAFWAKSMDSSDSVNYGLLEVDEEGNRIVHDQPIEIVDGIVAARPTVGLQTRLHGRVMEVFGSRQNVSVGVLDMQGRVMLRRQLHGPGTLDLSGLRAGAYIVQLKGSGLSQTRRIQLR